MLWDRLLKKTHDGSNSKKNKKKTLDVVQTQKWATVTVQRWAKKRPASDWGMERVLYVREKKRAESEREPGGGRDTVIQRRPAMFQRKVALHLFSEWKQKNILNEWKHRKGLGGGGEGRGGAHLYKRIKWTTSLFYNKRDPRNTWNTHWNTVLAIVVMVAPWFDLCFIKTPAHSTVYHCQRVCGSFP